MEFIQSLTAGMTPDELEFLFYLCIIGLGAILLCVVFRS